MSKHFFSFFLIFFAGIFLALAAGVFAVNQVKTTESFITSSDTAQTTATTTTFSLYIGDDLSGVSTPVKSVYIPIAGVYTGGAGTLTVKLEDDNATQQIFDFPAVTVPTPFEVLYKDPTSPGKINPASAGTYSYTLGITLSGVTVYGLSAKAVVTHRYKPPSCGGGFAPTGTLESSTFDTGVASGAAYNWLVWNGALGTGNVGRVKLQLATSNNANEPSWTYYGQNCNIGTFYEPTAGSTVEIGCPSIHNNKRYFRYKVTMCSANNCTDAGATTPTINDVYITWSP